jgi:hypothetical protein
MSADEPPDVTLTFNADAIVAAVARAMKDSLEVIAIAFRAIDTADLSKPPVAPRAFFTFTVDAGSMDPSERRTAYENWLLSKGLQELARALKKALEHVYLYVHMVPQPPRRTTWGEVEQQIEALKARANGLPFPDLLKSVSDKLTAPLQFADEYLSLQKIRNCMEHRAGIVGVKDTKGRPRLRLILPSLDIVLMQNGTETILERHPEQRIEADTQIVVRRGTMTREYSLGERIVLTIDDFQRIAQACHIFTVDLKSKLPGLVSTPATGSPTP